MKKSLRSTTSIAASHQGWRATPARKPVGTMPSSHPANLPKTQSTAPPQRRYCPQKKNRSVHHAGRKKRCPRLAGKAASSGQKTRHRKRKLSAHESVSPPIVMAFAGGG